MSEVATGVANDRVVSDASCINSVMLEGRNGNSNLGGESCPHDSRTLGSPAVSAVETGVTSEAKLEASSDASLAQATTPTSKSKSMSGVTPYEHKR